MADTKKATKTTKTAPKKVKEVKVETVLEVWSTVLDTKYNNKVVVDKTIQEAALRIPNRWK